MPKPTADGRRAAVLAPFARKLRELRLAAGNPSHAQLHRLDASLVRSTLSDALNGVAAPGLDLTLAFVAACARHAVASNRRLPPEHVDQRRWQEDWTRLHRQLAVLRDTDPARPHDPARTTPRQLPRGGQDLIGRHRDLELLSEAASPARPPGTAATDSSLVVIDGAAGVGKTALVLHWARLHATDHPDGQLFIDLQGFGPGAPRDPAAVLQYFLTALRAEAPERQLDADELAGLWRTATADRRMLVVLDNAWGVDQIRPLLPASDGVTVIATSRVRLDELIVTDGARRLALQPLDDRAALTLLCSGKPPPEQGGETAVVALCGGLPIALRIARVLVQHGTPPSTPADLLGTGDPDDRSSISTLLRWSLDNLAASSRQAFLRLGMLPGGPVTVEAASALLGAPRAAARRALADLHQASLLGQPGPGTFRFHDLVHAYARHFGDSHGDSTGRSESLRRWITHHLLLWDQADRVLLPQRGRPPLPYQPAPVTAQQQPAPMAYAQALAWCDDNVLGLLDVADVASAQGEDALVCHLADCALAYFNIRKPWAHWLRLFTAATASAQKLDDPALLGAANNGLGIAHRELRDTLPAVVSFTAAADAYRDTDHTAGLAMALNNLGLLHSDLHAPEEAVRAYTEALGLLGQGADLRRTAIVAHNLAETEVFMNDLAGASEHATLARDSSRQLGDPSGEAAALTTLGVISARNGQLERALPLYEQALHTQSGLEEHQAAAITRQRMAELLALLGDTARARELLHHALHELAIRNDPLASDMTAALERLAVVEGD